MACTQVQPGLHPTPRKPGVCGGNVTMSLSDTTLPPASPFPSWALRKKGTQLQSPELKGENISQKENSLI